MGASRRTRIAGSRRLTASFAIGAVLLAVAGTAATAAAWTDAEEFGADAAVTDGFDVQARVPTSFNREDAVIEWGPWQDLGLPGDPDTDIVGNELIALPVVGVQPGLNYAEPISLCNAGAVDVEIVDAEIATNGVLVDAADVLAEAIDIGSIIPADSCRDGVGAPQPLNGLIQFTTKAAWVDDDPLSNPEDQIRIRIFCREVVVP